MIRDELIRIVCEMWKGSTGVLEIGAAPKKKGGLKRKRTDVEGGKETQGKSESGVGAGKKKKARMV